MLEWPNVREYLYFHMYLCIRYCAELKTDAWDFLLSWLTSERHFNVILTCVFSTCPLSICQCELSSVHSTRRHEGDSYKSYHIRHEMTQLNTELYQLSINLFAMCELTWGRFTFLMDSLTFTLAGTASWWQAQAPFGSIFILLITFANNNRKLAVVDEELNFLA